MKLGALAKVAADVASAAKMVIIDVDTQRPLTSNDKECFIEFFSVDSEAGRKLERERSAAIVRKMRSGRTRVEDDDDPVDAQVEMLVSLAAGWFFGDDADPFTKDGARALFADPEYAWLRKQALVFVSNEANFMKRSSKA